VGDTFNLYLNPSGSEAQNLNGASATLKGNEIFPAFRQELQMQATTYINHQIIDKHSKPGGRIEIRSSFAEPLPRNVQLNSVSEPFMCQFVPSFDTF
jgi:hypothetical protein